MFIRCFLLLKYLALDGDLIILRLEYNNPIDASKHMN